MKSISIVGLVSTALVSSVLIAKQPESNGSIVSDEVVNQQRAKLAESTKGLGFGPQSPRDIDSVDGANTRHFGSAPAYNQMNLCNIHIHKNAEHKGGMFTRYAGNGDGKGHNTGFQYSGKLTADESKAIKSDTVNAGDTIELHYVHTTAKVKPGATLGSCLSDSIGNPQLRVETQVFVLVNDSKAMDFVKLTSYGEKDGYYQALNIPNNSGTPVVYNGSTTGPSYNEKGSPFQVTWSVRPEVLKVDVNSVIEWFKGNDFKEDHAHGVRNLVTNPDLLSIIEK